MRALKLSTTIFFLSLNFLYANEVIQSAKIEEVSFKNKVVSISYEKEKYMALKEARFVKAGDVVCISGVAIYKNSWLSEKTVILPVHLISRYVLFDNAEDYWEIYPDKNQIDLDDAKESKK